MKRNKIISLLISQILLIFIVFFTSFVTLPNNSQLWNNNLLKNKRATDVLKTSTTPNLLNNWSTTNTPYFIDMSADGRYFVVGEWSLGPCNVSLYEKDGIQWFYNSGANIFDVVISADGQYMVSIDSANNITLFNQTGFLDYYTSANMLLTTTIIENGSYFIVGDINGWGTSFNTFNPEFNGINLMLSGPISADTIRSMDVSADYQFAVCGGDSSYVTYGYTNGTVIWDLFMGGIVWSVDMTSDGYYVAAGSSSNNVTLSNRTGLMWNFTTNDSVNSVAISQDGKYIVAGSDDNKVILLRQDGTKVWDYDTGYNVYTVAISADGKFIVAGDNSGNITLLSRKGFIWNYTTGGMILDVAISVNGQYIVAGSLDQHVYLFYNPISSEEDLQFLILGVGMQQIGAGDQPIILFSIIGIGLATVVIIIIIIIKKRK